MRNLAIQAFVDPDTVPQTVSVGHFAVLGNIGEVFENRRLREVFVKLANRTLTAAYVFLKDAIEMYAQHFRGIEIPEIPERNVILSEKCPRKPLVRLPSQRARNGSVGRMNRFDVAPQRVHRALPEAPPIGPVANSTVAEAGTEPSIEPAANDAAMETATESPIEPAANDTATETATEPATESPTETVTETATAGKAQSEAYSKTDELAQHVVQTPFPSPFLLGLSADQMLLGGNPHNFETSTSARVSPEMRSSVGVTPNATSFSTAIMGSSSLSRSDAIPNFSRWIADEHSGAISVHNLFRKLQSSTHPLLPPWRESTRSPKVHPSLAERSDTGHRLAHVPFLNIINQIDRSTFWSRIPRSKQRQNISPDPNPVPAARSSLSPPEVIIRNPWKGMEHHDIPKVSHLDYVDNLFLVYDSDCSLETEGSKIKSIIRGL